MNVSVASAVDRSAAVEAAAQPVLAVKNIEVIYNHVILVLRGVSLEVPQGKIVALLGGNGAGKSTTLKSISTLLASERGAVTKGSIEFRGQRTDQLTPGELVGMGMVQVMEGQALLRASDRRGEPDHRRLCAVHQQVAAARRARPDLRLLPAAEGAANEPCRLHLGRRAADDRDRPRHDGEAEHAVAR